MDVRKSVADPLAASVNVLGTVQVLTASVESATRSTVYGEPRLPRVSEDAALSTLPPCAAAKVPGEAYVAAFGGLYGLNKGSRALANVYGLDRIRTGGGRVFTIFVRT